MSSESAVSVERAATLPGELAFLAAIADDLQDDFAKRVYADWLEERGDPRAEFVRKLAEATRSLSNETKLPNAGMFPRAWTNMLGMPLWQGLVDSALLDMRDAVLHVVRPILTLVTERVDDSRIPIGASKFGGLPDLPADVEWPNCAGGSLAFLAQINLRDLDGSLAAFWPATGPLPREGTLSFFAFEDNPGAYDFGGDTRVIYTPATQSQSRRPAPDATASDHSPLRVFRTCRLSMCETWDLPAVGDVVPPELSPAMETINRLREDGGWWSLRQLRRQCHPFGHYVMGYPLHSRTDDPTPGPEWRHLLCLDSDDNLGWNWCDGEHLSIWVHAEDLQNGAFHRVFGYAA